MFAPLFALATLAAAPAQGPHDRSGIRWLADDWDGAKKKAAKEGKRIAIDVWASWCHSCLSMEGYVLTAAPFKKLARRHVWMRMDFDNPKNGEFFEKFPQNVIPTFMVIDPKTEDVLGRWIGAGTVEEMVRFFDEAGVKEQETIALGQRALAKGDYASARRIFVNALEAGRLEPAANRRVLSGYLEALWKSDTAACAREGAARLGELENTVQGLDAVTFVGLCAAELTDEAERKRVQALVRDRLAPAVGDRSLALLPDDRSSYYEALIEVYDALGDQEHALEAVHAQLAVLEDAAARAVSATQRSAYEWHRMGCYLRLERFSDAEKMLLESAREEPKDFNHPWRLALVYLKQGKLEDARGAIDRALAVGYGGRRLRLYSTKIEILTAEKRFDEARRVAEEARAHLTRTPKSQVRSFWIDELAGKMKALEEAAAR